MGGARAAGRAHHVGAKVVGSTLLVGGIAMCGSVAAYGSSSGGLTVSPNTNLIKGQLVSLNGAGLAKNSKGYVVECNMAPHQPTVQLGPPVNHTLNVGCSPPSLKSIYSTNSTGALSSTFVIRLGRKRMGPPCGPKVDIAACPPKDSTGGRPGLDTQFYPCPPTPAQQVAGVTCHVLFLDAAGNLIDSPIYFAGGGPSLPGTGGGSGGSGGGGSPGTTTTTRPKTPPVTTTTAKVVTVGHTTGTTAATTNTTRPPTRVASGSLAYTGPGPLLDSLLLLGGGFTLAGIGVLLTFVRRPSLARRQRPG